MPQKTSQQEMNALFQVHMQQLAVCQTLYLLIHTTHPSLAPEITGMIVELENSELLPMLESPQTLPTKVEDASAVYEAHVAQAKTPAPIA
ncbi:unnamed protein product [Coregonus sp. 'balchen']|nr:unnamed protein product [Coregonus sp. 'balchen']